jgi:hypothetical protein
MKWLSSELPIGRVLSGKGELGDYMMVVAMIAGLALFYLGVYIDK